MQHVQTSLFSLSSVNQACFFWVADIACPVSLMNYANNLKGGAEKASVRYVCCIRIVLN